YYTRPMHVRPAAPRIALAGVCGLAFALVAGPAREASACRVIEVNYTPAAEPQVVIWVEDAAGGFVDTLYMPQDTGRYGLGHRPGMMEFNSEFEWPYGRRESVFPVWAHRRGVSYPKIVFQNGEDTDLSHPLRQSSVEPYFCRPLGVDEPALAASL